MPLCFRSLFRVRRGNPTALVNRPSFDHDSHPDGNGPAEAGINPCGDSIQALEMNGPA